jgi:hypothetical protein
MERKQGFYQGVSIFSALILSLVFFFCPSSAEESLPYWKKSTAYQKVVDERQVLVSVTDHEALKGRLMKLNGGGQIRAPKDFTVKHLQDFKTAFSECGFIKKLTVDEKHHFLFIRAEVYGFSNSMKIKWEITKDTEALTVFSFKVLSGIMRGFTWSLNVEPAEKQRADVGIQGEFPYTKFPMPSFFLKFGLEVIFQRVAIDIRTSVEKSLKEEGLSS